MSLVSKPEGQLPGTNPADNHRQPRTGWVSIGLLALVVLTFSRTVGYGLFQDDYMLAREWSIAEVLATFHGPFDPTSYNDPYFRPLASLLFAIEWQVWGTDTWGYHLSNIVLHALVTVGLWLFLRRLPVPWWAAVGGAAFFSLVPSNSATVLYIAERTDAMVAGAILAGWYCIGRYFKEGSLKWIAALVSAYGLALGSKEVAVAFVPAAAVYWLYLNMPAPQGVDPADGVFGTLRHWSIEFRGFFRGVLEPRRRSGLFVVVGVLVACTLAYIAYHTAVMPAGSLSGRFAEGLNPLQAFVAALHGTFKGTPWEVAPITQIPLLAAFLLGFLLRPAGSGWRIVMLGAGLAAAGVAPLCFNGGVEPRLLYVAELGMAVAITGLLALFAEAYSAASNPGRRTLIPAACGAVSLAVLATMGVAQFRSQDTYKPGTPMTLEKDLLVWMHPESRRYVPGANLRVIQSHLEQAGMIGPDGQPTAGFNAPR